MDGGRNGLGARWRFCEPEKLLARSFTFIRTSEHSDNSSISSVCFLISPRFLALLERLEKDLGSETELSSSVVSLRLRILFERRANTFSSSFSSCLIPSSLGGDKGLRKKCLGAGTGFGETWDLVNPETPAFWFAGFTSVSTERTELVLGSDLGACSDRGWCFSTWEPKSGDTDFPGVSVSAEHSSGMSRVGMMPGAIFIGSLTIFTGVLNSFGFKRDGSEQFSLLILWLGSQPSLMSAQGWEGFKHSSSPDLTDSLSSALTNSSIDNLLTGISGFPGFISGFKLRTKARAWALTASRFSEIELSIGWTLPSVRLRWSGKGLVGSLSDLSFSSRPLSEINEFLFCKDCISLGYGFDFSISVPGSALLLTISRFRDSSSDKSWGLSSLLVLWRGTLDRKVSETGSDLGESLSSSIRMVLSR